METLALSFTHYPDIIRVQSTEKIDSVGNLLARGYLAACANILKGPT